MNRNYRHLLSVSNSPIQNRWFTVQFCTQNLVRLFKTYFSLSFFLALLARQTAEADIIDDTTMAMMARSHIPGLSLAVIQDGRIIKAKAYGAKAQNDSTKVDTDTLFQAGPLSQWVAAFGTFILVEKGKISLDSDINRALVNWRVPENEFTQQKPVTLRHILNHTAGFPVPVFRGYPPGTEIPTLKQILEGDPATNSKPITVATIPGEKENFSSGGFLITQELISELSHEDFPAFIDQNVFKPLDMKSSTYEQPLTDALEKKAATGHINGLPLAGKSYIYPQLAAAGLWTTPSDFSRFIISVQNAYLGTSPQAISRKLAMQMMAPEQGRKFGLGVFLYGPKFSKRFFNDKHNVGYFSTAIGYVDSHQGAVIMGNADGDSGASSIIMASIECMYNWPDYQQMKNSIGTGNEESRASSQVLKVLDQAKTGNRTDALLSPAAVKQLNERLDSGLREDLLSAGEIKKMSLILWNYNTAQPEYYFVLSLEHRTFVVDCVLNQEGKIIYINL